MHSFVSKLCIVGVSTILFCNASFAGMNLKSMPSGFDNEIFLTTVAAVQSKGRDEDYVKIAGRLTNFLGEDHYEFVDLAGNSIEVELDDDVDWSNVHKDQLIELFGEIDRNMFFIIVDAKGYRPLEQPSSHEERSHNDRGDSSSNNHMSSSFSQHVSSLSVSNKHDDGEKTSQ